MKGGNKNEKGGKNLGQNGLRFNFLIKFLRLFRKLQLNIICLLFCKQVFVNRVILGSYAVQ